MIRLTKHLIAIAFSASIAVALCAEIASAQGSRKDDIVFNAQGRPMPGATVRVCTSDATGQPCAPLAPVYSDAALTQALANPLATDGLGNYTFYAAPGRYTIELSGPGITSKQIANVILPSDPSSPTFTSVTTTSGISAFSLSLAGNLTVSGSAAVTGALTAGGNLMATAGQNSFTAYSLDNIIFVDGIKYATIQAAVTAACNGTVAGSLIVPPGTYQQTATLSIPSNCDIFWDHTTITSSGFNGDLVSVNGSSNVAFHGKPIINGSGAGTGATSQGLAAVNSTNFSFEDIEAASTLSNCFEFIGNTHVRGSRLYGTNCGSASIGGGGNGIYIGENGATKTSDILIGQIDINGTGQQDCGFVGSGSSHVQIAQFIGNGCADEGFEVNGLLDTTSNISIDSVDVRGPKITTSDGVLVRSASQVHVGKAQCSAGSNAWAVCTDIAAFTNSDPSFSDVVVDQVISKSSANAAVTGSGAVRISMASNATQVSNVTIGNVVSDSDYNGVYCVTGGGTSAAKNIVIGNILVNNATSNSIYLNDPGCTAITLGPYRVVGSAPVNIGTASTAASNGMVFQMGCNGTATSSVTLFAAAPGSATPACTDTTGTLGLVMPSAGTITNLRVKAGTPGFAAGSGVFTILKNGAAQTVTCTVGTGTTCNDVAHSFTVAAGDVVKVQFTTQATETLANVNIGFEKQ